MRSAKKSITATTLAAIVFGAVLQEGGNTKIDTQRRIVEFVHQSRIGAVRQPECVVPVALRQRIHVHLRDRARGVKRHQVVNEKKFAARWQAHLTAHEDSTTPLDVTKDRGARGRVLVIDAVMLQPDRDSGSLRMFNLLLVMRRLGFKVSFMPSISIDPR